MTGLTADTVYHYPVVAHNDAGTTNGPDQTFRTFPPPPATDPCENALVRKQTGAALVPDCRAYELVSAADQGGYDVESDLCGPSAIKARPDALDKVLYSLHYGALRSPGARRTLVMTNMWPPGVPTDGGRSTLGCPRMACRQPIRTARPWPARTPTSRFRVRRSHICNPCFEDGSSNIPLRLADGGLVKGMAGSLHPAADPVGEVRKHFSDDGSHFIFASDQQFEGSATAAPCGSMTATGVGHPSVSTLPSGSPIPGEVAELDVSSDGSRVLVGKVVGEDGAGNRYYDLYMHIGTNPNSVKVIDSASGAIYDGMTSSGEKVFFTTPDPIVTSENQDTDESADLFRADVGQGGATVQRVSTGSEGTGNTDSCEPITDWRMLCRVAPIAARSHLPAGPASHRAAAPCSSSVPERLDGSSNGVEGQPNLYVAESGQPPHFIATIDSSLAKPGPQPPEHPVASASLAATSMSPKALPSISPMETFTSPSLKAGRSTGSTRMANPTTSQPVLAPARTNSPDSAGQSKGRLRSQWTTREGPRMGISTSPVRPAVLKARWTSSPLTANISKLSPAAETRMGTSVSRAGWPLINRVVQSMSATTSAMSGGTLQAGAQ